MRRLLPDPAESVDVLEAYALPPGRHVRANMVASVDGTAAIEGRSGPLSGPVDMLVFGALRALSDVVLVGASTARTENYGPVKVNAERRAWRRAAGLPEVPPLAVVTRSADIDPTCRMFDRPEARPIVLTCATAPADRVRALAGVADVVVCGERSVDLPGALDALAERGLRHVLTEGGPHLLAQLIADRLLDQLCLTVAPRIAGAGLGLLRAPLPAPVEVRIAQLLEQDGHLFCSYDLECTR